MMPCLLMLIRAVKCSYSTATVAIFITSKNEPDPQLHLHLPQPGRDAAAEVQRHGIYTLNLSTSMSPTVQHYIKLGGFPSHLPRYFLILHLFHSCKWDHISWAAGHIGEAMLWTSLGVQISWCSSASRPLASQCCGGCFCPLVTHSTTFPSTWWRCPWLIAWPRLIHYKQIGLTHPFPIPNSIQRGGGLHLVMRWHPTALPFKKNKVLFLWFAHVIWVLKLHLRLYYFTMLTLTFTFTFSFWFVYFK